jgi:3-hydroxyisobutyrate dehydrogenase
MQVAVLGTGAMGAGMARSVARAGLEVTVWNRTKSKALPLGDQGLAVADTVTDAVAASDVVITMVFDARAVLEIADELVDALGDGAVWLQCATVGPQGMTEIAAAAAGKPLLDVPVLGTKEPAEEGALTVLVSGDPALVDQVHPVLDAIGSKTVYAGEQLGQASALKLVGNAWMGAINAAAAQSLALASVLGLDGSLFLQAIHGAPTDTPFAQLKGPAMIRGDYSPSFAVDGLLKDLNLVAAAAEGTSFSPTLLDALRSVYRHASETGHGHEDIAAVRTAFDK